MSKQSQKNKEMTQKELEHEIPRYVKAGDTFTARNLLNNFSDNFKNFNREKYLKIIQDAEKQTKKIIKEE